MRYVDVMTIPIQGVIAEADGQATLYSVIGTAIMGFAGVKY